MRPPSSLQQFLEETAAQSRAGHLASSGMIKPSGLIDAARIADRHREAVTLLFPPTPPVWLQRLIFPPLAALGRRRARQSFAR